MRIVIRPALIGIAVIPLLAACETTPPPSTFPELSYGHLAPLRLDVKSLEVVSEYAAPLAPPHVEHEFPWPPADVLARWARDRLQPVGERDTARFIIHDARVTETALVKETGFKAVFTRQQSERYDAVVEATLEIRAPGTPARGHAAARVTHSTTVSENTSVNERKRIWFRMTEALMADFNTEMERNIRRYLVNWMR